MVATFRRTETTLLDCLGDCVLSVIVPGPSRRCSSRLVHGVHPLPTTVGTRGTMVGAAQQKPLVPCRQASSLAQLTSMYSLPELARSCFQRPGPPGRSPAPCLLARPRDKPTHSPTVMLRSITPPHLQRHRVLREDGPSPQRISDEVSVMEEVPHDVWGQGVAQRRRASLDPRRHFHLQ